ncbi:MAG: ClpXP protease specificity-enhancing factor [Alcanivoracaceae bacterium]|jgi:stringent starvation protein B|nr:ClpXP protease specificity-enhancing factor [Alcanivoracaceae bacterium]
MSQMTPNRPYLLRAIYQWICDNGLTPHMLVDAHFPGVRVPQDYVQDGHITLNIAPRSVAQLVMDNDQISFSARFSGVPQQLEVPPLAVLAIYARENGQGMAFDPVPPPEPPAPKADKGTVEPGRSHLKVIK